MKILGEEMGGDGRRWESKCVGNIRGNGGKCEENM